MLKSMGAKTAFSEEQYLHTSFPDLDKEFQDGELVERSLPNYQHGKTQLLLGGFFLGRSKTHRVFPSAETRLKLRPGLYLIPDVSVFHPSEPGSLPDAP